MNGLNAKRIFPSDLMGTGAHRAPRWIGCGTGGGTGGAPGGSAPAPFDPVAVFGASLWGAWLAADSVVADGLVSLVPDLGGVHDLAPWSPAAHSPAYDATGSPGGSPIAVMSRPAGGANLQCVDDSLVMPLHFMILMRWAPGEPQDWENAFGSKANGGAAFMLQSYFGARPNGQPYIYGEWTWQAVADGAWHVVDVFADEEWVRVGVDGASQVSEARNPGWHPTEVQGLAIGNQFWGNRYTNLDFIGAIAVTREMTADERADSVAWLQAAGGI